MHDSVMAWAKRIVREHNLAMKNTLEVGSYNVNGSVRAFFKGPYVGIDVTTGPGVDVVARSQAIPFQDSTFEVVASTEMLEHDAEFWISMREMGRVLKLGGDLLLTARGNGFPYHGDAHYKDVYRFMPDSVPMLLKLAGCTLVSFEEDSQPGHAGILVHGRKHTHVT